MNVWLLAAAALWAAVSEAPPPKTRLGPSRGSPGLSAAPRLDLPLSTIPALTPPAPAVAPRRQLDALAALPAESQSQVFDALGELNAGYYPGHERALPAAAYQRALGDEIDSIPPSPGPASELVGELAAFSRTVHRIAGHDVVVPFLSDAEPLYAGLRILQGPDVDENVKLAYINRMALKSDGEKLAGAHLRPGKRPGDSTAYNNWLRESEVYNRLSVERPARADELASIDLDLLSRGVETSDGILIDPGGKGAVLQQGLLVEARVEARRRAARGEDPKAAFLDALTERLSAILAEEPRSAFALHVTRLYDSMRLPDRDALFVDTGLKGTIPALMAALHRIKTGRRGRLYLYSASRGYEEVVPALRPRGNHRVLERAPKFGQLGGFGADGQALVGETSDETRAEARRLIARLKSVLAD